MAVMIVSCQQESYICVYVYNIHTVCCFYNSALHWRHNGHNGVSNHQPHDSYSTGYLGADQRKHESSASLAFVRGIHRRPVNSPHKGTVTRNMFLFDDVIMVSFLQPTRNRHPHSSSVMAKYVFCDLYVWAVFHRSHCWATFNNVLH